jgi:hypothetical protein
MAMPRELFENMTQNKMYKRKEDNYANSYSQLAPSTKALPTEISSGYLGSKNWALSKVLDSLEGLVKRKANKPSTKGWAQVTFDSIGGAE